MPEQAGVFRFPAILHNIPANIPENHPSSRFIAEQEKITTLIGIRLSSCLIIETPERRATGVPRGEKRSSTHHVELSARLLKTKTRRYVPVDFTWPLIISN